MDYRLALMAGIDIPIPACQITLHQPTIKEIAYVGERDFFTGIQCLCLQKNMVIQDESLLQNTTNFQIFMTIMQERQTIEKKESVISALTLLFPSYQVVFTPRSLMLTASENSIMIDEANFEDFQQVISQVFCIQNSDAAAFNPGNKKAKEIADKLMKARKKVAQLKAEQGGEGSVLAQYVSSLTVGIASMALEACLNLTIYQLYDLMERYSLYTNWDLDLKSRLAGGKPDKPVENWMKNIH